MVPSHPWVELSCSKKYKKPVISFEITGFLWSLRPDSNRRPAHYERWEDHLFPIFYKGYFLLTKSCFVDMMPKNIDKKVFFF